MGLSRPAAPCRLLWGLAPPGPLAGLIGCDRDGVGICVCLRQSRCGCLGQGEPPGCEEQRPNDLAGRREEELKIFGDMKK